ncbi:MAG TPA: NADPH:quinone reductase [Gemmatales bacterium]|nr:NADPH:quinone reductase [Gemmatales bacterium]HMP58820.1 NADPH:quinone reductase [Gemmatales bacterium]
MRAAYIMKTGGPEVIQVGELPTPSVGPGQALVQIAAASVNPIDTYLRSGVVAMALPQPYIPGCDLAGTVTAVGEGVTRVRVGQRVWASNQGLLGRQGTFAEFAVVDEPWLHAIPDGVSDATAAGAALVGITAHLGLFRAARLQPGDWVYVSGGTGGVGSMVVQMAKAAGAKVATTVGSPAKVDLARELGADCVMNYKNESVADVLMKVTEGRGVDVWYETQREPDFLTLIPTMARRGRIVVMAGRQAQPVFPVGPFYTRDLSLFGFAMFNASPAEQQACATSINEWLQQGKVKVVVGKTFALEEAAAAHRLQEENTLGKAGTLIGKIIVQVSPGR